MDTQQEEERGDGAAYRVLETSQFDKVRGGRA